MWTRREVFTYAGLWALKGTAATLGSLRVAVAQRWRPRPAPLLRSNAPLAGADFQQISEPGFGDRWNTYPWSMQWWRGQLYVGTDRAFPCIESYLIHQHLPALQPYPPKFDPDLSCPERLFDLSLQAEVWRYTPERAMWERVYQSPQTLEVPDQSGSLVAPDIGLRGMIVFTEPDGAEALYVSGVSPRIIDRRLPPPRLLRSTDGVTFAPIPQEPGTVLGDVQGRGFRALVAFGGSLYVTVGTSYGAGVLLQSSNPAAGSDSFQVVSPPGMLVNEMVVFNGYLYLGLLDSFRGYSVVKIDASEDPPTTFHPVVPCGAYRPRAWRGMLAQSMRVFKGRLYVGTEFPAEMICIRPSDEWDLIVGTPRRTPTGMKYPLSGMGIGFDFPLNIALHRMEEHNGWLYVGTFNLARRQRRLVPLFGHLLDPHTGFDLYATEDGIHFRPVTRTGLGDLANICARTMSSTPVGLFVGAVNERQGLKIYLGGP